MIDDGCPDDRSCCGFPLYAQSLILCLAWQRTARYSFNGVVEIAETDDRCYYEYPIATRSYRGSVVHVRSEVVFTAEVSGTAGIQLIELCHPVRTNNVLRVERDVIVTIGS